MSVHGFFAGVNGYRCGDTFRELRYAVRDARAVHALFEDNCPDGEMNLSLDREVTKRKFLTEIGQLADRCRPDDLAVIYFSGHGTSDGHLVMHDSDPADLDRTGLPLEELARAVHEIRASRRIIVLDCCFAGGHFLGGRALYPVKSAGPRTSEHARDGRPSPAQMLGRIHGDGWAVLTAAGEEEAAYEDPGWRHGILTHHLIQGLLGRGLDVANDEIPLTTLFEHIMEKVRRTPMKLGRRPQRPVLATATTGMRIKVLEAGEKYRSIAGEKELDQVTRAFSTLEPYGIPEQVYRSWERKVGKLTDFQSAVINRGGLLNGEGLLVSAPTSGGKTLLGEIAALRAVAAGGRAVFLVPTRALADEMYRLFTTRYAELGVTAIRVTGGRRESASALLAGRFGLAVCTYEMFYGLLHARPGLLSTVDVLVIDEIQTIGMPVRGPKLELLLTRIRADRRMGRPVPQVIGLSSAMDAGHMIAEWAALTTMTERERPVPLHECVVTPDGRVRIREDDGTERAETLQCSSGETDPGETARKLVQHLVEEGHRVIVFRPRRQQAWTFAERLANVLDLPPAEEALGVLPRGDDGRLTEKLRACLARGVAFHIADLSDAERAAVEACFGRRSGGIRVVVATTTLAQGVNLPAECVVVHGLEHPSAQGELRYPVSEYKNMAGRAGRLGHVKEGRAFIIADDPYDAGRKWRDYVQAEAQPMRTAFTTAPDDLPATVLSVVAGHGKRGCRRADVQELLALTLASYQYRHEPEESRPFPPDEVHAALDALCQARLLWREEESYKPTHLGKVALRSGLSIGSIITLVEVLSDMAPGDLNPMALICAAQLTVELDDIYFPGPENGLKTRMMLRQGLLKKGVPQSVLDRMTTRGGDEFVSQARRAIACYMWSRGSRLARIERTISPQTPAAHSADPGPVRQVVQRAAEVVQASLEIAADLWPDLTALKTLEELPLQLEYGLCAGLASVARHADGTVQRSVFLDLADAGITDAVAIVDAADDALLEHVGGDTEMFSAVRKAAEVARDWQGDDLDGLLEMD